MADIATQNGRINRPVRFVDMGDGTYALKVVAVNPSGAPVSGGVSSTGAMSSVGNSATSFTVLAANAARKGATLFNDDTAGSGATVKVAFANAASATAFSVELVPRAYCEVPFGYTGIVTAIASVATGNMRITELT